MPPIPTPSGHASHAPGRRDLVLTARHYALLAAFALALFLPGRIGMPPLDRDESRYMEATAQMLRSHDFIDVRFQDKPRYLQPAGIYWLEAAATALVAPHGTVPRTPWPYRIPSLVAAIGAVLLTAGIGAMLFGGLAGLLAAVLLATSVLLTAESRMATIDTTLLFAVLLAEAALIRAWKDSGPDGAPQRPTPWPVALLYWAALGCGLMLKGPVILIPGLGTPAMLALIERRTAWWRRLRPAWGVPLMFAIALPWCVAIWLVSHGQFFARAVGNNFLGKVASGQQAHGLPPGYHLLVFAIAFWPGALFALRAAPFVWARRRTANMRILLCWLVPHWLVFEAIATKLPHYVLPAYPAIALLAAAALADPEGAHALRRGPWRWIVGIYGVVWLVVGLALAAAGPGLLWYLQHRIDPLPIVTGTAAAALVLWSATLLLRGRPRPAAGWSVLAAILAYLGIFGAVIPNLTEIWLSPRIAATLRQVRPCPDSVLASASFSEPSLVFLAGQDTRLVDPAGAADFLAANRACGVALIGFRDLVPFQARAQARGIAPHLLGHVTGLNYSNGRHLDLGFFSVSPRS